ncbi:MAG: DUF2812 domain-containing protein [Bacillus sp. (in: firmicutes)]
MIKVFRPFWSYDVKKTETWLSSMAKKGYIFDRLNRWTRSFFFRQDKPKDITYRIGYDKIKAVPLSRSLVEEGWVKVIQRGNWYVMSNEQPLEQIKTASVREGIIKHNNKIKYLFSALLIYFLWTIVMNLSLLGLSWFQNESIEVVESPLWIITYTVFVIAIAVFILAIYSVIKINRTNKHLINENSNRIYTINEKENRLPKAKEKQLKQAGQMVVKRKFAWWFSPDKLEKWLERMEQQGYNLYRVNRRGTAFYFIIGSPRTISYCLDYQNISSESYFNMHREAGWKSVYASSSSLQKWTIWSHIYAEGEERPQIYSDQTFRLKQAKKVAITYSSMFFPFVIIYTYLLVDTFRYGTLDWKLTAVFSLNILIYGVFTIRTLLYYLRIRKRRYSF